MLSAQFKSVKLRARVWQWTKAGGEQSSLHSHHCTETLRAGLAPHRACWSRLSLTCSELQGIQVSSKIGAETVLLIATVAIVSGCVTSVFPKHSTCVYSQPPSHHKGLCPPSPCRWCARPGQRRNGPKATQPIRAEAGLDATYPLKGSPASPTFFSLTKLRSGGPGH